MDCQSQERQHVAAGIALATLEVEGSDVQALLNLSLVCRTWRDRLRVARDVRLLMPGVGVMR